MRLFSAGRPRAGLRFAGTLASQRRLRVEAWMDQARFRPRPPPQPSAISEGPRGNCARLASEVTLNDERNTLAAKFLSENGASPDRHPCSRRRWLQPPHGCE